MCKLDLSNGLILKDGKEIELTHSEVALLKILIQNRGDYVSTPVFSERLSGMSESAIRHGLRSLRGQLAGIDIELNSRRTWGYRLPEKHKIEVVKDVKSEA